jgi:hypothetical protein
MYRDFRGTARRTKFLLHTFLSFAKFNSKMVRILSKNYTYHAALRCCDNESRKSRKTLTLTRHGTVRTLTLSSLMRGNERSARFEKNFLSFCAYYTWTAKMTGLHLYLVNYFNQIAHN